MTQKKYLVLASGRIRQAAIDKFQEYDDVELISWQQGGRMPAALFEEQLAQADAVFSAGGMRLDAEFIKKAPRLKVLAQASVGYDNIDVAAFKAAGIPVGNTPGVLVDAVADLAYALILDSARQLVRASRHVTSGAWGEHRALGLGSDLAGKTLGIVGMGDIGSAVAQRAQASKMHVIYHNRRRRADEERLQARYAELDELLAQADVVLAAVTLNPSTKGLFDAAAFAKMKKGAAFINISRGQVADTEALYEALAGGHLSYAGLDVTDPEPLPGEHKLLTLPNVTVTPHMASATAETRDAMALLTVANIMAGLHGEPLPAEVR